jgi:hypothetical protein
MKRLTAFGSGIVALIVFVAIANAVVMTRSTGSWPKEWPKELESLREQSRTLDVANGTQEEIYEIKFSDRAQFEKFWPTLLSLKTPGAPLRLYKMGPDRGPGEVQLESNAAPVVRIYGPTDEYASIPGAEPIRTSGPWPKEIIGAKGELPEFVCLEATGGQPHWVPLDQAKQDIGFRYRARIDVDLVVDGQVIDLNRIRLPDDGLIQDHRF